MGSTLREQVNHRNGNNARTGMNVWNGSGGVNQLRRTDPKAAAEFVRWQIGKDSETECPVCEHYADNHDETGCQVLDCRCHLGIGPR